MSSDLQRLGSRVGIWAVPGSGKSTLARHIGDARGLPVIELDAIRHARGWDSVPWPEARQQLEERFRAAPAGFVVDGHYSKMHDVYLPRLDTMIWMPMPLRVTLPRLFRRSLQRAGSGEGTYGPGSARETWRRAFFSRESMLWYSLKTHRSSLSRRAARVQELREHMEVIDLPTVRAVDEFTRALIA